MTLVAHVDHLRTLAQLDPETTVLQLALINVLEELAITVDRLATERPDPRPPWNPDNNTDK
jgi:hypothetical protein